MLVLSGAAAASAVPGDAAGSGSGAQHLTGRDLPAVLAGLASQQVTRRLGDGCWARFYESPNFRGRSITVVGPVDLARLDIGGSRWGDWNSAVVGPQASVTTFDKQGFRDPTMTIGPGRQVPDLRPDRDDRLAQLRSAHVDCVA